MGDEKLKNRVNRDDPVAVTTSASILPKAAHDSQAGLSTTKQTNGLITALVAWYATSVVCTNTTKTIGLPWQWLTLAQLVIGSLCAYFGIAVLHLNGKPPSRGIHFVDLFPATKKAWQSTTILAACFVGGFVTLNMALGQMHVSTVMTVRAAEPVSTLLLGLYFLPNEKTSKQAIVALIPVVAGAAMASTTGSKSSTGSEEDGFSALSGLLVVLLCNCLFSLRTILTKRLRAAGPSLDNFTLFFQLCVVGSVLQLVLLCFMTVFAKFQAQPTNNNDNELATLWIVLKGDEEKSRFHKSMMLIINGISFYAYLQLSWVVMGQVGAVTHSVCNALRRPVICAAGWIMFGGATAEGVAGALVATAGTLLYAQAEHKAAVESTRAAEDVSSLLSKTSTVAQLVTV